MDRMAEHPLLAVIGVQAIFIAILGHQHVSVESAKNWAVIMARYLIYLPVIRCLQDAYAVHRSKRRGYEQLYRNAKVATAVVLGSSAVLVAASSSVYVSLEEFVCLFLASLASQYLLKERKPLTINYGVGMACSFFEGYLKLIIPADGTPSAVGFEDKIRGYESTEGVVFPVRKLILVVTKSLFCPPDLCHYNDRNRPDLPHIEAMTPLSDVTRDVAGVKNRPYRNSAYKIYREPRLPVCITAEFATPLHTLYKVLINRDLYDELCDVDREELVRDFCAQVEYIIEKSPDTRGRCHLVHFDDTVPNASLAEVLLREIEKLEPDFEEILERHHREIEESNRIQDSQDEEENEDSSSDENTSDLQSDALGPVAQNGPTTSNGSNTPNGPVHGPKILKCPISNGPNTLNGSVNSKGPKISKDPIIANGIVPTGGK